MRYITLKEAERQELENLHKTSNNFVVRERCLCLLLSAKGNSMVSVASLMNINKQTVRRLVHKWDESDTSHKFSALYSAKGQGAKMKLDPVSALLPELVEKHSRNLKPILAVLENEHSIKVSKQTLQNFLKGAGL